MTFAAVIDIAPGEIVRGSRHCPSHGRRSVSSNQIQIAVEWKPLPQRTISVVHKTSKDSHDKAQQVYFDEHASFFCQPIPKNILERTRLIAAAAALNESSSVLDVGSGAGAMIVHMLEFGVQQHNIVACDLSAVMIENCKKRFEQVNFWQGDILDFSPEQLSDCPTVFDAIFFNACFGNIWDQYRALEQTQTFCRQAEEF